MVLHSTYLVAKHKVMPMDLVAVDTIKERVYSFLSVTWAIMADVDIESEKYRSLGGARFTVGGLARILSKNFTISLKYATLHHQVVFYLCRSQET